jgi:hypothetical protein
MKPGIFLLSQLALDNAFSCKRELFNPKAVSFSKSKLARATDKTDLI